MLEHKRVVKCEKQVSMSDLLSEEEHEYGHSTSPHATCGESTALNFQIPKIYCSTKDKKYNLFDRHSYAQLVAFLVESKIVQGRKIGSKGSESESPLRGLHGTQHNRGIFYNWLKKHLDLENSQCNEFITENESSLRRLKNKRQLLMFLSRKFEKIHQLKNEPYHYAAYTRIAKGWGTDNTAVFSIFLFSLLFTVVSLLILFTLFFKTSTFETLLYSHPQYTNLIKISKAFLKAMIREL